MRWKEFTMPTRFEFEADSLTPIYGRFVMEPFERGYALTVGNALRRSLLSSIEGAAPVSVKIEGAPHEFGTLPGVHEDVMDIILAVRQLKFRLHGAPPKTLRLELTGERKVTGKDFEANADVELLNPDQLLATLTEKTSKFSLEIEVDVGRGFVPSDRNKRPEAPIGVIPLDANFSPVSRVRYEVENTRVGQVTDFERLILEVWTDGRVTPENALNEAGLILKEHFLLMARDAGGEAAGQQVKDAERVKELLGLGLEELELSVRSLNALHSEGLRTIGELTAKTDEDLLTYKNFGRKSLDEIKAALAARGLALNMPAPSSAG